MPLSAKVCYSLLSISAPPFLGKPISHPQHLLEPIFATQGSSKPSGIFLGPFGTVKALALVLALPQHHRRSRRHLKLPLYDS